MYLEHLPSPVQGTISAGSIIMADVEQDGSTIIARFQKRTGICIGDQIRAKESLYCIDAVVQERSFTTITAHEAK